MVRRRAGGNRPGRQGVTATLDTADHPIAAEEGAEDTRSPQRRCIATGEVRERGALLRFVVGPDGTVVPDVDARLPGRGLWLTPRRDIVDRAVAKRSFARAARRPVTVPPDLADRIEVLLARRCGDTLGLARRAGIAVAGFDRVGEAARHGRAALLLCALDGSEGGRRKLAALGRGVPSAAVLTAAELGAAFGRDHIVYGALSDGTLCRRLLLDLGRLAGFRPDAELAGAELAGAELAGAAAAAEDCGTGSMPAEPAPKNGGTEAHD